MVDKLRYRNYKIIYYEYNLKKKLKCFMIVPLVCYG